jgi:hypothetical protein
MICGCRGGRADRRAPETAAQEARAQRVGNVAEPPVLADVLIENDVILPEHLQLLDDPEWLELQATAWWS